MESECGDQHVLQSLFGFSDFAEERRPVSKMFRVIAINSEIILCEFHLTYTYYIVLSINKQVYLPAFPWCSVTVRERFARPRAGIAERPKYAHAAFYLAKMQQTYLLKRIPWPCIFSSWTSHIGPEMLILSAPFEREPEMKQRKKVC